MGPMYGQERLQKVFNSYTIESLPKTIILIGLEGCGKHLLSLKLAERLGVDLVKIGSETTKETLSEYYMSPIERIYYIDLTEFKEKQQNIFLKFIEEPSLYMHVILSATSEIGILPTILNRGIKYHFDQYSIEELKNMSWMNSAGNNDLLYKVCKTPGQIIDFDGSQLDKLYNLCLTIVNKIQTANISNTLGIYTKINYKEDYNLYDFNVFLNMLELCAYDKYIEEFDEISYKVYRKTNEYKSKFLEANNPIKEQFMINFLINLWEEVNS